MVDTKEHQQLKDKRGSSSVGNTRGSARGSHAAFTSIPSICILLTDTKSDLFIQKSSSRMSISQYTRWIPQIGTINRKHIAHGHIAQSEGITIHPTILDPNTAPNINGIILTETPSSRTTDKLPQLQLQLTNSKTKTVGHPSHSPTRGTTFSGTRETIDSATTDTLPRIPSTHHDRITITINATKGVRSFKIHLPVRERVHVPAANIYVDPRACIVWGGRLQFHLLHFCSS